MCLLACSFFISGGDNIEFEISLDGVRQRELCGTGASNNREDTYQTTLYVPEDKAPGGDMNRIQLNCLVQLIACYSMPAPMIAPGP